MAKQVVHSKKFGFVAGLNTEASFLTSPENTWREGQNVIPRVNGELHRRQGIDLENGYELSPAMSMALKEGAAFTTHEWNNVGGVGGVNFIVAQIASTVYFYDNFGAVVSPTVKPFSINLTSYKVAGNPSVSGVSPIACSSGNGKLIIVSPDIEPLLVVYTASTDSITVTAMPLTIRDFEGVDDGTAIESTPTTLTDVHYYNLYNQGWDIAKINAYYNEFSSYPSKALTWFYGKDTSSNFDAAKLGKTDFGTTPAPKGRFKLNAFNRDRRTAAGISGAADVGAIGSMTYSGALLNADGTGANCPNGTYLASVEPKSATSSASGASATITVNSFSTVTSVTMVLGGSGYTVSDPIRLTVTTGGAVYNSFWLFATQFTISGTSSTFGAAIPNEIEVYRPNATAFFAGRAWYAGVSSQKMSTWVMFSQVAELDSKLGNCYQDADPTSEVVSDLVASDGGVIPIQEAGQVVKLLAFGNSLLVFADNGVWQVSGGQGGFSALDYSVRKISSVPCVSPQSIVEVESVVFFMGNTAIYAVQPDQSGMFMSCAAITDTTIKTLITSIPVNGKKHCKGYYIDEEKHVYWLYNNSSTQDGLTNRYVKNTILVFDVVLKAFYTTTIASLATLSPEVLDAIVTKGRGSSDNDYIIVDNSGNNVVETLANGNQLIAAGAYVVGLNKTTKWLTCVPQSATAAQYTFSDNDTSLTLANEARFADWYSVDAVGVEDSAYILTGYDLMSDNGDKNKAPLYITVYSRATETGFDSNFIVQNPSSILMQAQWEWTDSIAAGKWSSPQEVYRHTRQYVPETIADTPSQGHPLIVTKNKVRGSGKSLSLKFTAGEGKDMKLVGWETTYIGNANV